MELVDLGGWPGVLGRLTRREHLTRAEAAAAMADILDGNATSAQIAGFIVALRMKGEQIEELSGLLDAMLGTADLVTLSGDSSAVIDIVGSGGDQRRTINVSTLAALTAAGAGARVCKHGNRAVSSSSGSADLLEALGVALDVTPEVVARCVTEAGMGFCFAPRFHPAMRHAGPSRRELGVPTVFNYLGPIANPARVRRLVMGVGDPAMARPMLEVLAVRGAQRAWVVHGKDGMDELSTTTSTSVLELRNGTISAMTLDAADYGIPLVTAADLAVHDVGASVAAARRVLGGEQGPHRDIVVLNAAAGLLVAGVATDLADGITKACAALDDGRAEACLRSLVRVSNEKG